MYCRLRSIAVVAHHFKINESNVRTVFIKKEKEFHEAITAAMPAGAKSLPFWEIPFYLILKMQFLCGYRIAIRKTYL